jgi:hypothetical protein
MPALRTLLEIDDATEDVLRFQLDGLRAWPLSIAYVIAGATRFRIERQGKLNPKPWNLNPRQAPRNPWA